MNPVLSFIYDWFWLFLLVLIINMVFVNKKFKDYNKLKPNSYVKIFITRYDLDVRKLNYDSILLCLAFVNAFILSFTAVLIIRINSIIWKIVICFLVVFILIYSLYEIVGRIFKKKEKKKNV